ncbi:pantoate--beta-alanine ligase [Limibacillus halophilus]|uniref:pantoate--beta-alanine ligase n=1 Tax=Limibacillus halophilus TaxID=1579333 RepID=UPI0016157906|nr:pantoate--beta-alanine ligase [Limibacillus halophilus]
METIRRVAELRARVSDWRAAGLTVGLVPTMGALHAGHLQLVRRAFEDCDRVVVSIFVNPLQFDRPGDLASYPRDEAADREKLVTAGVQVLYGPLVEEMYPEHFSTGVMVAALSEGLCGAHRPGHFGGVATVVSKLLLQCLPDRAYFGEKDFQQLRVIERVTRDLDIPATIVPVETVREPDGLAMSSRNRLLTDQQRRAAPKLFAVLTEMAVQLADGTTAAEPVLEAGRKSLSAAGFERVEYLELRDSNLLRPLERADRPSRLFAAAWLGAVRLIDNLPVIDRQPEGRGD